MLTILKDGGGAVNIDCEKQSHEQGLLAFTVSVWTLATPMNRRESMIEWPRTLGLWGRICGEKQRWTGQLKSSGVASRVGRKLRILTEVRGQIYQIFWRSLPWI